MDSPLSIAVRRGLVRELVQYPLSYEEIGQVLGFDVSTIANDISALRRAGDPIARSKPSYAVRLAVYVQTLNAESLDLSPEITIEVQKALHFGLNLDGFEVVTRAMIDGINMARAPKIPPHLWNTQRLVHAIFGYAAPIDQFLFRPWDPRFNGRKIDLADEMARQWYPRMLSSGVDLVSTVKNHVDLARQFVAFHVYEGQVMEHHIAPINPDRPASCRADVVVGNAVKERLDNALAALSSRYREVLRLRYPEDGSEGEELSKIGKRMELSRERIRQIEAEALKEMRTFLVADDVDIHPVSTFAAVVANVRNLARRYTPENPADLYLTGSIAELNLSPRAQAVIEELGLSRVFELRGEGSGNILHAVNGGRSVADEVKSALDRIEARSKC
ncbi:MAG: sigma factor-like helix-turn-helix DNA-binding protein [Patescibacteria group bacterium]